MLYQLFKFVFVLGTLNGSLVLFEREDLYVCGVSAGAADLRMIARPGDTLHVQVTINEKR